MAHTAEPLIPDRSLHEDETATRKWTP